MSILNCAIKGISTENVDRSALLEEVKPIILMSNYVLTLYRTH
jgi:hypothetical protein